MAFEILICLVKSLNGTRGKVTLSVSRLSEINKNLRREENRREEKRNRQNVCSVGNLVQGPLSISEHTKMDKNSQLKLHF